MKFFAVSALFLVLAIQAYAQPTPVAAPVPATAPEADETQSIQPEAPVYDEKHVGAAKDKRAILVYTSAVLPPVPTFYRYSYLPFYPVVPPTTLFV